MSDQISRLLLQEGLLLKKFRTLDIRNLTKSRSYSAYFGVDMSSNFTIVFVRDAKSRFVQKDSIALSALCGEILKQEDKVARKKILFHNSPMCSKALKSLKDEGFKLYAFV